MDKYPKRGDDCEYTEDCMWGVDGWCDRPQGMKCAAEAMDAKQEPTEGVRSWSKDGKLYKYAFADSEGDGPNCAWQDCPRTPKDAFAVHWNTRHAKPRPVRCRGKITHYVSYPWEDVQETREHKGLPWYVHGNPWVWVVEFEREERK